MLPASSSTVHVRSSKLRESFDTSFICTFGPLRALVQALAPSLTSADTG